MTTYEQHYDNLLDLAYDFYNYINDHEKTTAIHFIYKDFDIRTDGCHNQGTDIWIYSENDTRWRSIEFIMDTWDDDIFTFSYVYKMLDIYVDLLSKKPFDTLKSLRVKDEVIVLPAGSCGSYDWSE